ncbi:MAG: TauD/TfdA family dioxygenase [Proteobacteria bacterium]|nr:TauD/TfdA family dioxygenase [Pseudomonadota bacterium]
MPLEIRPLSDILGAEISGLDLAKPIDDETFAKVHQAHLDYLVIVFRDQALTPDHQIAFSERFGALFTHDASHLNLPVYPKVMMISTKREAGKFVGLSDAGAMWHSDQCYRERPALGTLLYAVELPDSGGDTAFANLYAAHDALPSDLHRAIKGRLGVFMTSRLRAGRAISDQLKPDQRHKPPQSHPLIRTHPETGRKSLFISEQQTVAIEGLPEDEGQEILERLFTHCAQPEFVYWHQWRPGDLTFWDNRCTAHKADLSRLDDPTYIRHMHRTTIIGDKPF